MPSNLSSNFDTIALIESRITADEALEVLGITLGEMLEYLPEGSVEALEEYLEIE